MAIKGIQFQQDLSLADFMKEYGTEAQCEAAFVKARWPQGFECPCCGGRSAYQFMRRALRYWQCGACRHQTSLRAGTLLEHGHLPFNKWYLAIYLMVQSNKNIAARALMRQLDISWKAAWLLKRKLVAVMPHHPADPPL